jgi:hypothetical protein
MYTFTSLSQISQTGLHVLSCDTINSMYFVLSRLLSLFYEMVEQILTCGLNEKLVLLCTFMCVMFSSEWLSKYCQLCVSCFVHGKIGPACSWVIGQNQKF